VVVSAAPLNVGVIYLLAVGSIGVYGVTVGAYASNNKFAFLGGLRATAQMLAYEIPMGLCVLIMILYYKTPDAMGMVGGQLGGTLCAFDFTRTWGVFAHPFLAAVFFTCVLAECNRAPFDLAECEQELVGGFHTEYGSMKWAMYFLGEYMHMIVGSAFFILLFLGGWEPLPFIKLIPDAEGGMGLLWVLVKFAVFAGKVTFLLFAMMWIRWTLPRFRFDQLMRLAWNNIIPLMLLALLANGALVALAQQSAFAWAGSWWAHLASDGAVLVIGTLCAPFMPKGPPTNRKVPLEGSRFSPPAAV
jgi:NADH-quinone oxidoreductase subunit H